MNAKFNYNYRKPDWAIEKSLLCPVCFEILYRIDIESFSSCPYCNNKINIDYDMEDYILKPTIDRWVMYQNMSSELFSSLDAIYGDRGFDGDIFN